MLRGKPDQATLHGHEIRARDVKEAAYSAWWAQKEAAKQNGNNLSAATSAVATFSPGTAATSTNEKVPARAYYRPNGCAF